MKERQPKKVYWGVVDDMGDLVAYASRKEALATAARWMQYVADPYAHVVRLTPEVVKTVRRRP